MGRVYAENRSKMQKPLGFKGLSCNLRQLLFTTVAFHVELCHL